MSVVSSVHRNRCLSGVQCGNCALVIDGCNLGIIALPNHVGISGRQNQLLRLIDKDRRLGLVQGEYVVARNRNSDDCPDSHVDFVVLTGSCIVGLRNFCAANHIEISIETGPSCHCRETIRTVAEIHMSIVGLSDFKCHFII